MSTASISRCNVVLAAKTHGFIDENGAELYAGQIIA